jgi:hypothetical protein
MNSPSLIRGIQYSISMQRQNKAQKPAPKRRVANQQNNNMRAPRAPRGNSQPSQAGKSRPPFAPAPLPLGGAQRQESVAAAYSSGQRSGAPRIQASRDQVRIVHRELIGSITGSQAFAVAQTTALNPGLSASFPWLSTQAQSWERYRFNKLRFCYYTRTGSNVPGSVQMVPDYDASDSAPVSEQVASTYEDVEEDAPWKDIECELRPSALHALGPSKFIRTGGLLPNQDIKTYDAGNFFLATTDGTAVNWGKLWVEYDVTLMTPQLPPGGGGVISAQAITGTTPTTASILPTPVTIGNSSNIVSVVGEVVTFNQAGQFEVVLLTQATTATVTGNPAFGAGAVDLFSTSGGSGTSNLIQFIQMTAVVGSTITFNNTIVAGTASQLVVSQLPTLLAQL